MRIKMAGKTESEHITKITKNLISSLYEASQNNFDDGTGYIKSVKTIIQGLESYLAKKDKVEDFEEAFLKIKNFSKKLWIKNITEDSIEKASRSQKKSDILYYDFCFEYIFEKGEFPL